MKRSAWVLVLLIGMAACGKDSTVADVPDTAAPEDAAIIDDTPPAELAPDNEGLEPDVPDVGPELALPDVESIDIVAADPDPVDPGTIELPPAELPAEDLAPLDPGTVDMGPEEVAPPDPDADLSDNARACVYVMENICAKALTKCDVLHLIPANWMQTCTDFLVGNHAILRTGCQTLDEANTADPNIALIQSMGPYALEQCVDNFECTLDNILKVYNVLKPIIGGQKMDVGSVVGVVAEMCFK